jgi:hypothetical protein
VRAGPDALEVSQFRAATHKLIKADVFGNGHVREQCEILPNYGDPVDARAYWIVCRYLLTEYFDLRSVIWLINTRHNLDQGALSTTILPCQTMDFANSYIESYFIQGLDASKAFGNMLHSQCIRFF